MRDLHGKETDMTRIYVRRSDASGLDARYLGTVPDTPHNAALKLQQRITDENVPICGIEVYEGEIVIVKGV